MGVTAKGLLLLLFLSTNNTCYAIIIPSLYYLFILLINKQAVTISISYKRKYLFI